MTIEGPHVRFTLRETPTHTPDQDGNEAAIPDPRRGFHPLGDENRLFSIPAGTLTGEIRPLSGEPGKVAFVRSPSPSPVGALLGTIWLSLPHWV